LIQREKCSAVFFGNKTLGPAPDPDPDSAVFFGNKTLDPVPDPDPDSMNPDPHHCFNELTAFLPYVRQLGRGMI
jgi:hypothetical protein